MGLERCRRFLAEKAPEAAQRAAEVIQGHLLLLEQTPDMGRPDREMPHWRELLIPFGDSGFVTLYRHDPAENVVYLLAFRHQKEAGY